MSNISTLKVNLSDDHLKRVSKASPIQAIEELIWNSLDADATNISVRIESNAMGNQSITIEDNGSGISQRQASTALGYIGNSWKATRSEKARLKFYQEQLRYEADTETSLSYLHKTYSAFIPKSIQKQAYTTESNSIS